MINNHKPFFYSNTFIFIFYAFAAFFLYAVILPTPFKSLDDYISIVHNTHLRSLALMPELFRNSFFGEGAYYRPLTHLSFMLEYHFFKLDAFYYNVNNVIFHILNTWAVFWMVVRLTDNRRTAFFTALLFVIHPVHWECVGNVAGRSILLSAFFLLYGFLFYMKFYEKKRLVWYLLSFVFFAGSLLSKESGIMFLGVVGIYLYLFQNPHRKIWIQDYLGMLPFILFFGYYVSLRLQLDILSHIHWANVQEVVLAFGSFLNSMFHYLQAMIFPTDFYFDFSYPLFSSFHEPKLWLAFVFWFSVVGVLIWRRRTFRPVETFFLLWIGVHFFPVMQFAPVRISDDRILTSDHFLYLPIIGFLVIFVEVVTRWMHTAIQKKSVGVRICRVVVILYMSFLAVVCLTQNIYATNMFAMYAKALQHNPLNHRVRNSMAVAYALTGRFDEARKHFHFILEDDPHYNRARIGLAETYKVQEDYWQALREYDKITDIRGLEDFYKEGVTYSVVALLKHYQALFKENPDDPEVMYTLGVLYAKQKKHSEALEYFQKTLKTLPHHEQALFNIGTIYSLEGQWTPAKDYFQRVLANQAKSPEEEHDGMAYSYLGQIAHIEGNVAEAKKYFQKSKVIDLKLNP